MNRFFVPVGTTAAERFPMPASIAHHVRRVLRLREGDGIVLLEGDGREVKCRLDGDDCVVESRTAAAGEPQHRLTVCQALLKGDGLEEVVRHGTEVGVARFRLIVSERCVPRDVSARRLERLRSVAREAAEQAERGIVPPVDAPVPMSHLLAADAVLLYERHDGARLSEVRPAASVVIGPEGGFAPLEVAAAEAAGATLAGLGPRILRSETVAPVVAALILSRTGDFA